MLAYTPFVKQGGGRGRDIALTFDDGPGPYTPEVLDVLERLHVPPTFFAIGEMQRYFSASTEREIHDGDVIGDHTADPSDDGSALARTTSAKSSSNRSRASNSLAGRGRSCSARRMAPSTRRRCAQLHALHLLMVLWSVDTDDYLQPGVPAIVAARASGRAARGDHPDARRAAANRAQTVAALPHDHPRVARAAATTS